MIVHAVTQRTPEWMAVRLGKLTGSKAAAMLATIQKGEAAGRRNLRMQLVLERVTGKSHESGFVSPAMQQGTEREVDALALYEAVTGNLLQATGFVEHDLLPAGCSLDGHIGNFEGIAEVKSPLPATHWEYLKTGVVPGEYLKQIVHGLWITGAQWCDWLSYNPDFPVSLQSKLVRVVRDDAAVERYNTAARAFLLEVELEVDEVLKRAEAAA